MPIEIVRSGTYPQEGQISKKALKKMLREHSGNLKINHRSRRRKIQKADLCFFNKAEIDKLFKHYIDQYGPDQKYGLFISFALNPETLIACDGHTRLSNTTTAVLGVIVNKTFQMAPGDVVSIPGFKSMSKKDDDCCGTLRPPGKKKRKKK